MSDWRENFAIKSRNYPKIYQAPDDGHNMLMLKMLECMMDETLAANGGQMTQFDLDAMKAEVRNDPEKRRMIQDAMDRVYGVPA